MNPKDIQPIGILKQGQLLGRDSDGLMYQGIHTAEGITDWEPVLNLDMKHWRIPIKTELM